MQQEVCEVLVEVQQLHQWWLQLCPVAVFWAGLQQRLAETFWQAQCVRAGLSHAGLHTRPPPRELGLTTRGRFAVYESVHLCMRQEQLTWKMNLYSGGWAASWSVAESVEPGRRREFRRLSGPGRCRMGRKLMSERLKLFLWLKWSLASEPILSQWECLPISAS